VILLVGGAAAVSHDEFKSDPDNYAGQSESPSQGISVQAHGRNTDAPPGNRKEPLKSSSHCGTPVEVALSAAEPADIEYTCPMHPDVRQRGPGSCPECGMALEPAGPPMAARTEYVCPMHPEVVQDQPGNCPKCGMALEPRTLEAEEDDSELRDMSRRFWGSAVLAVPVFLSAMAAELWPEQVAAIIDPKLRQWLAARPRIPACPKPHTKSPRGRRHLS